MRINNNVIKTAATVGSFTTNPVALSQVIGYAVQVVFTGSPAGTLKLQASVDSVDMPTTEPTNWTDIANSMVSITASGDTVYNVIDVFYTWMRVVYTNTSGTTGSVTVTVNTKGV